MTFSIEWFPYLFLVISMILAWVQKSSLSFYLFLIAWAFGFYFKNLELISLVGVSAMVLSLWASQKKEFYKIPRVFFTFCFVVFSLIAMLHLWPGFHNLLVLKDVYLSETSAAYRMYLNFDKPLVGLAILWFFYKKPVSLLAFKRQTSFILKVFVSLTFLLIGCAYTLGFVVFDFKTPDESLLWVLNNLFFVCLVEELFFRGYLQESFEKAFVSLSEKGAWLALFLTNTIFALAHAGGGVSYMGLSFVAGLGYGFVYMRTKRMEGPLLIHFGINAVHFFFFSYPYTF